MSYSNIERKESLKEIFAKRKLEKIDEEDESGVNTKNEPEATGDTGAGAENTIESGAAGSTDVEGGDNSENGSEEDEDSEDEVELTCFQQFVEKYMGIVMAASTSLFISITSFFVAYSISQKKYKGGQLVFWRFIGLFFTSIIWSLFRRFLCKHRICKALCPPCGRARCHTFWLLTARSILGVASLILQFYSFKYATLADSTVIIYCNHVVVGIIAKLFLKENYGWTSFFCAMLTIGGVVVINSLTLFDKTAKRPDGHELGIALAIGSMLCTAMVYILIRYLKDLDFVAHNIYFSIFGLVVSSIMISIDKEFGAKEDIDYAFFVGISVFSAIGQYTLTIALIYEEASIVALIRTLDVILSFLWQMTIHVYPHWTSLVGGSLVLLGILIMGFRKIVSVLNPEESRIRRRFKWLLR